MKTWFIQAQSLADQASRMYAAAFHAPDATREGRVDAIAEAAELAMTMARTLGLTREAAARFSFLLAVPGIGMAGSYEMLKLVMSEDRSVDWGAMGLGVVVAAVTGYLCIAWLLRVINRIGLAPFALYRFAVAAVLFWLFA